MLTREEILNKAFHDCMCEMYAKAQPAADWDNILEEYRSGKIQPNESVYERHYLSSDEFVYIRDKYKEAYNIKKTWVPNIEFLESRLTDGGLKDKYIPDHTDEYGNHHPGYRSAEDVKPIKNQILNALSEDVSSGRREQLADYITTIVMNTIKNYKDFYHSDREVDDFDCNISLGGSPCSNAETVKKWWKDNYNVDIEIEERNPKLFWYRDMGYTDEDLEEEFDDPNWKTNIDLEWKAEIAEKEKQHKELMQQLQSKLENVIGHADPAEATEVTLKK